jgi:hypothetical protein
MTEEAKKPYDADIDAFEKADTAFKEMQEKLESGAFLAELFAMCQGDLAKMQSQFKIFFGQLRQALENRNTALKSAQNALRQVVMLAPSQWRGPEGRPTTVAARGFNVTSVTSRWFDPESLMQLTGKAGLLERMMELTYLNKDGKSCKVIQPSFEIEYDELYKWLKSNRLDSVIDGAYDEKEKTPQVKGPKELAFLGDKKS